MAQISLALLGVGRWGTHLLRNFLAHPQVQVRAVVDPNEAQLRATAQQFGLADTVPLLTNWQAALALDGLTAVAIATPAATHDELVHAALEQDLHVLVEKPLTLDTYSSALLGKLAATHQRQLVIDHTYLFHPVVAAGQQAVAQIGPRRYGYATRTHLGPVRQDVDALWDLAIHDIAIFNHWLGETPSQVQAHGRVWQQMAHPTRLPLFSQGLADVVWCRLRYPSGFEAMLHLCWANPDKQRRLCMVGDEGTLIFDELSSAQPLILQQGRFLHAQGRFIPQGITTAVVPVRSEEPLKILCDHFVDCVRRNQPSPISSAAVGTTLVSSLQALSQSLNQEGQWIAVSQPDLG
jgi:predicted dehydrogenase